MTTTVEVEDDLVLDGDVVLGPLLTDVEAARDRVVDLNRRKKWRSGERIELGTVAWMPSAVTDTDVLHVTLSGTLPPHIARRLRLAREKRLNVIVALTVDALFRPETLKTLAEVEADVLILEELAKPRGTKARHLLAAMADLQVPVAPEVRTELATQVWEQRKIGTKNARGSRLEALLAFIFSQTNDLRVVERNFRTMTQEIDLVLQIDNFSERVWQTPGKPLMLVEAKNTKDKSTQAIVSLLGSKLQSQHQRVQFGFVCSVAGFTRDAQIETVRYSQSDVTIVLIGSDEIQALIESDDLDSELERIVRSAILK